MQAIPFGFQESSPRVPGRTTYAMDYRQPIDNSAAMSMSRPELIRRDEKHSG